MQTNIRTNKQKINKQTKQSNKQTENKQIIAIQIFIEFYGYGYIRWLLLIFYVVKKQI